MKEFYCIKLAAKPYKINIGYSILEKLSQSSDSKYQSMRSDYYSDIKNIIKQFKGWIGTDYNLFVIKFKIINKHYYHQEIEIIKVWSEEEFKKISCIS